jgi:hypothetical protein
VIAFVEEAAESFGGGSLCSLAHPPLLRLPSCLLKAREFIEQHSKQAEGEGVYWEAQGRAAVWFKLAAFRSFGPSLQSCGIKFQLWDRKKSKK